MKSIGPYFPFLFGLIFISCSEVERETLPPNIILIVADDLGYGDLSCYGGEEIKTPNLDKLAERGIRLNQFYAGSAVCTPSRASILTGNSPLRYNIRQYFPRKGFLPTDPETIPEMLHKKGYYSAHIGKWHLGGLSGEHLKKRNAGLKTDPGPLEHGFDHYLTMLEGDPNMPNMMDQRNVLREGGKYLISDDKRMPADTNYITSIITNEAIKIARKKFDEGIPFFLNLWYKIPHTPYEKVPDPHYSIYKELNYPEPPDQNFHRGHNAIGDGILYNSMVSYLDAEIGRLIDSLEKIGVLGNALILFTSDNGPSYRGSPGTLSGGKADLHEGGMRVPMIISWPGILEEGIVNNHFGHTNDLLPTLCEAAGINTDSLEIDGISILDQLKTKKANQSRGMVFWQMDQSVDPWGKIWYPQPGKKPEPYSSCIVRKGNWKMHFDSLRPVALYNIEKDEQEIINLLGKYPQIEEEFEAGLIDFLSAPRLENGRTSSDPRSL